MKIFLLLCFLLCLPTANLDAQDINFGWSLGTLWIYYDAMQNKINADVDVLHFDWLLNNRIIIGFNLVNVYGSSQNDEITRNTILPLEIGFIPLIYEINTNHQLCLSLYGKMGWHLIAYKDSDKTDDKFFGSIGSQLFLQFKEPNSRTPYSRYLSLFAEYTIFKVFRAGIVIDISPIIIGLFLFNNN